MGVQDFIGQILYGPLLTLVVCNCCLSGVDGCAQYQQSNKSPVWLLYSPKCLLICCLVLGTWSLVFLAPPDGRPLSACTFAIAMSVMRYGIEVIHQ